MRNEGKVTAKSQPSKGSGLMTCPGCGAKIWTYFGFPGEEVCEFCAPADHPVHRKPTPIPKVVWTHKCPKNINGIRVKDASPYYNPVEVNGQVWVTLVPEDEDLERIWEFCPATGQTMDMTEKVYSED
jgi:hypothetical protein